MVAKLVGLMVGVVVLAVVAASVLGLLAAAAAVYGAYRGGRWAVRRHRVSMAADTHRRAELLARAEIQHRWWLDGDARGTYGRYPPLPISGV